MAEITITALTKKVSNNGATYTIRLSDGTVSIMAATDALDAAVNAYADALGGGDDEGAKSASDAIIEIVSGASDGIEDAKRQVNFRLERVSRHITCDGMHLYYDGAAFGSEAVQLDPALEKHMLKLMTNRKDADAKDWGAWANFAENLYANVKPYVRKQLVSWMEAQGWLSFMPDGRIVGYRGGQINAVTGVAESVHAGPAIVNDEIVNGHVPNPDGGIVEIDRNLVKDDPSEGCASGLHVGTFDYASGWAQGVIMRVAVDPRDVVSVPVDCNAQKIRCCRFEVLDHVNLDAPDRDAKLAEWGEELSYRGCGYDDYDDDYEDDDYEDDYDEDDYDDYDDEPEDDGCEIDWQGEGDYRLTDADGITCTVHATDAGLLRGQAEAFGAVKVDAVEKQRGGVKFV